MIPLPKTEPRWPAILTFVLVFGLLQLLPSRYQVFGPWFLWVVCAIGVASMLAVALAPTSLRWHLVERLTITGIFVVACGLTILSIIRLIADMLDSKHGYSSITLLETATEIWTVNILTFALLYWQADRSGPETRGADFHFAEKDDATTSPWEPQFVDYLFLAFATSTSFTPPDYSRPSSHRAKLMLMLQATISLTTLFLIASRAISTLS